MRLIVKSSINVKQKPIRVAEILNIIGKHINLGLLTDTSQVTKVIILHGTTKLKYISLNCGSCGINERNYGIYRKCVTTLFLFVFNKLKSTASSL